MGKKVGLAIVNRGFYPMSHALGEALLRLAEVPARTQPVCVITQSDGRLKELLRADGRGEGVRVMDCRSRSESSTPLLPRILDSLVFMVWTFVSLVRCRPAKVYVATNPPVVVPFIVFLYCKLFGARYYYHLQDIHPEATESVVRLNPIANRFLRWMDNVVMRHAERLITLSEDMKQYILARSGTKAPIHLLDNPAVQVAPVSGMEREAGLVFCGNAGRLQRIPLLLDAICDYTKQGGGLTFTFAGAGLFAPQIAQLAEELDNVTYHGVVSAERAAELVNQNSWALLPIDDDVTRYAFPSKSSSYVLSGCRILAICGEQTSVARWVLEHGLGKVVEPEKAELVAAFKKIESGEFGSGADEVGRDAFEEKLQIRYFVDRLFVIMDVGAAISVECEAPIPAISADSGRCDS